jgi:transposase
LELINQLGGLPYIPFKKNSVPNARGSKLWAKLYKDFTENHYDFCKEYHRRSNIESAWSMIKRKFGDFCRCKNPQSQDSEILCKILCHNIVVLIFEIFNRGLKIDFEECQSVATAQKVVY